MLKSNLVVVDLEGICWLPGDPRGPDDMEIIEVGALLVETRSLEPVDEFDSFIRPLHHPTLSDFCKELTAIDQTDIDQAEPFPEVLDVFLACTVNSAHVTFAFLGPVRSESTSTGLRTPPCELPVRPRASSQRESAFCEQDELPAGRDFSRAQKSRVALRREASPGNR